MLFKSRPRWGPGSWAPEISLPEMRANLAANGPELYVGSDGRRLLWAGSQQALLVLGPPRSGKTSSLVVPNILAAPGPVLVTSTKPDVLQATLASRAAMGRCWVLDPTGTVPVPPGANLVRWSPVQASLCWDEALVTAKVMTYAARPHGLGGDSAHWAERSEALLAPLLHASAVAGTGMRQVLSWVLRHDVRSPMAVLGMSGDDAAVAVDVLAGIAATDERERSGIFSSSAGTLAAYRSSRALDMAERPNFDPSGCPYGSDTVYVCAPARYQAVVAPVIVAFLEQVRAATYRAASSGALRLPVTFVLDEVANVAPLPDLPAMVSEGGGQGLLTMACLQDLSQARARWAGAADGFFSLFGTKVVLPGVGDIKTLEAVSRLAGQMDVPVSSVNKSAWWSGRPSVSTTYSWRRQARLPVDQAHNLPRGSALVVRSGRSPALIGLTPWWGYPPFAEARRSCLPVRLQLPVAMGTAVPTRPPGPPTRPPAVPTRPPAVPTRPPGPPDAEADVEVKWQRVKGQRRLHPPPPRP